MQRKFAFNFCDDGDGNAIERNTKNNIVDRAVIRIKDVVPDNYEHLKHQAEMEET